MAPDSRPARRHATPAVGALGRQASGTAGRHGLSDTPDGGIDPRKVAPGDTEGTRRRGGQTPAIQHGEPDGRGEQPAERRPGGRQPDDELGALFAAAPFGLGIVDGDLRFERVNPALAAITGRSAAEHVGRGVTDVLPDLPPEVVQALRAVLRDGEPSADLIVRVETPAEPGAQRFWRVHCFPLGTGAATETHVGFAVDEVSERVRLESELDRLADRSRMLTDFYAAAVRRSNDEREILDLVAQRATDVIGDICVVYRLRGGSLEAETIWCHARQQRLFAEAMLPAARPLDETVRRLGLGGERTVFVPELGADREALLSSYPDRLRPLYERYPPVAVVRVPLRTAGEVVGTIDVARTGAGKPGLTWQDVDTLEGLALRASLVLESARAHRAAAETAARLEAVLQESPVATILLDAGLRVQFWNRAATEMFGWTEDELRGKALPIAPPDLADEIDEIRRQAMAGENIRGLQTRRLRRDGTEIEVEAYDAPYRAADGRAIGIVLRMVDIRERKRLEAELRQTSSTLQAILDASPLAVIAVDRELRTIFWSRGAERLYGWTPDEVLARRPPIGPPGDPELADSTLARVVRGELLGSDETTRRTKTGELIDVRAVTAPLTGPNGEVTGALAIHEDIRDRRRLESELFEARKMESIGRLAGGIAHDFNNILTAIIGFADLALAEPPGSDVHSSLTTIKGSAERAAGLTQQLLAFSRRQMLQPQLLDPNEIVLRMESMLRRLIGERVELAISVTPRVGSIRADRSQLEQVILNLAINARDAMADGGRLAIRTEHVRFDETSLSRHFEMQPGEYVLISVSDTGIGMDEATKAQIFEPFFTTKGPERGTGLGLATTYGIVKQSGGYIWVYSEPGQGSTFKLYFPASAAEAAVEPAPAASAGPRSGRILLVEDEPVLRELARQVLHRRGFEVLAAANAREADELARQYGEAQIDLLLTDVVMPGASGTELATRLRVRHPGLPVLLMSGYAEEIVQAEGTRLPGGLSFLAKPFTPDTLLHGVDEALASRPRGGRAAVRTERNGTVRR